MRRIAGILGLVLMLALVVPTFARNLSLGVVGGVNGTDIKITTDGIPEDVTARWQYGVGGVVSLHMSDTYSIELAPTFVRFRNRMDQDDPNPDIDMSFAYVQVPLFFKLSSPGKFRTYVKAGPVAGILLEAETQVEFGGMPFTADFSNVLKKLDLGLCAGLGVEIPLGGGYLFFEGRYVLGLKDVLEGGTVTFEGGGIELQEDISMNSEARSRSVQVMMGYSLPLGSL